MYKLFYLFAAFSLVFTFCKKASTDTKESQMHLDEVQISNWVDKNIPAPDRVDLKTINTYDMSIQREIFRRKSPEACQAIWQERLAEAKKEMNKAELELLKAVETKHTPEYFSKVQSAEDEKFYYEWMVRAENELGWSRLQTVKLLCTFMPWSKTVSRGPVDPKEDTGLPCNCTSDDYCRLFGNQDKCDNRNCNKTTWGCGWALMSSCTGRCHMEEY